MGWHTALSGHPESAPRLSRAYCKARFSASVMIVSSGAEAYGSLGQDPCQLGAGLQIDPLFGGVQPLARGADDDSRDIRLRQDGRIGPKRYTAPYRG